MVKYVTTAMALKAFSVDPLTRRMYRGLGNRIGNRRRRTGLMPRYYFERVKRMLTLVGRHGVVRDGDRVLELGTGWLHWEALTLRLFFDIEGVLFDVWDNRQLGGLKNYISQLDPLLDEVEGLSPAQLRRARELIGGVKEVQSFEDLYKLLGLEYVVDESGSLTRFADESFQLVVSAGVLEHVHENALPKMITETRRILRPGGWALHSIDTSDHLSHYDREASPKLYLTFSDHAWNYLFENQVQRINRVQRGEWLELFRKNRFELVDEDSRRIDISTLRLAGRFVGAKREDLECTVIRLALKTA